jgi:hypothetical protein
MSNFLQNLFYRQPNKFRFTLIENFVKYSVLPNAPQGWEGNLINWARSDTYFGMVRSFTVPMNFVLDGAWILRNQFYTFGIGAQVQLLIEKFNADTYNYETLFLGDVDFSNLKDTGSVNGYVLTCNIVEGGITKFVKAFEDVVYTIPLSDPRAITVHLTPVKLVETAAFIFTPYDNPVEDGFPGLQIAQNDPKATVISSQNVPNHPSPPVNFATTGLWFYRATVDNVVTVTGINISGGFRNNIVGSPIIDISIYKQDGTKVYTVYTAQSSNLNFNINFTTQIAVNKNDTLYLFITFPGTHGIAVINSGELDLKYNTISPATTCKAFRAYDLFQILMSNMFGSTATINNPNGNTVIPVPCQSYLLQQWKQLVITCGDSIRPFEVSDVNAGDTLNTGQEYTVVYGTILYGLTYYNTGDIFTANLRVKSFSTINDGYCQTSNNDPAIITSFKDFFKSINCLLGAGWGVENINGVETSVLEAKSYFYKTNLKAINTGEVGNFTLSVFQNYLYNTIKYGYADQTYDNINGNTEFNSTAFASFPVNAVKKELDLVSTYRADSTGIELIRVNLSNSGAGSSNTSGNTDVFFIHINALPEAGQTYYTPYVYPWFSGVDTNLYNMDISPRRNMLRHGDFIHGSLDKLNGEQITFTSALKNFNLVTTDANGVIVAEKDNISIASLPAKLFLPYQADILVKEPFNMLSLIDKYPTGFIQFVMDGNNYNGFIYNSSTDVNENKPQKLKLIFTSNNDLKTLIR